MCGCVASNDTMCGSVASNERDNIARALVMNAVLTVAVAW